MASKQKSCDEFFWLSNEVKLKKKSSMKRNTTRLGARNLFVVKRIGFNEQLSTNCGYKV
jgi:hypothetical protein